jgi:hypothetical protein
MIVILSKSSSEQVSSLHVGIRGICKLQVSMHSVSVVAHAIVRGCTGKFPTRNSKKLFLVPHTQPKLGKQAALIGKIFPSPPLPISSKTIFIKIDPRSEEFAMRIPQSHGFGNAVEWGHHLRVQLQS